MDWQTIESHTKDGEYFLIRLHNMSLKQKKIFRPIDIARWDGYFYRDKNKNIIDLPIIYGWMNLPKEPNDPTNL